MCSSDARVIVAVRKSRNPDAVISREPGDERGPMTASGIYQVIVRRGRQVGIGVFPHRFRHHFSHTWLDRGGAEGDLMELNGWTCPQMLRRYSASARNARARRSYDRVMKDAL
jgi:integrase